jgi:hypothetical protein
VGTVSSGFREIEIAEIGWSLLGFSPHFLPGWLRRRA